MTVFGFRQPHTTQLLDKIWIYKQFFLQKKLINLISYLNFYLCFGIYPSECEDASRSSDGVNSDSESVPRKIHERVTFLVLDVSISTLNSMACR